MSKAIQRDWKRRQCVSKYELQRLEFQLILQDQSFPMEEKKTMRTLLAKLPRNSSLTRVQNRCVISGRSRGVLQFFRLSRIVFRELAASGSLPGIVKKSW